jgi:hypothetical protein
MSDKDTNVTGVGTVLRGNFATRGSNSAELQAKTAEKDEQTRLTEEFERAARERIGGSIAFVRKLKNAKADVLFWDGEED